VIGPDLPKGWTVGREGGTRAHYLEARRLRADRAATPGRQRWYVEALCHGTWNLPPRIPEVVGDLFMRPQANECPECRHHVDRLRAIVLEEDRATRRPLFLEPTL
jgi:hypothetical protein